MVAIAKVKTEYDAITYKIIGAAMNVRKALDPGFPEEVYQKALAVELAKQDLSFEREKPIEVFYQDAAVGLFYLDFLVEDAIVVELKAVNGLTTLHQQQAISYLAASGREVALLINFGGPDLEYKRLLPPKSMQENEAYKRRVLSWKTTWQVSRLNRS